jgi:hypothetical protein
VEQIFQAAPDFSAYGLMMHADPVVKGVLIILVLASIACWAVILEKAIRLIRLSQDVRRLREAETKTLAAESERGLTRAVLIAAVRNSVGHRQQLHLDCAAKGHEPGRSGAGNCRGVDCDSTWSCYCDSRGGRL